LREHGGCGCANEDGEGCECEKAFHFSLLNA
jgi:hypothetical protein